MASAPSPRTSRAAPQRPSRKADDSPSLLSVEYYTDPLCCWSWAMEPAWRRLRYELRGAIRWRYRMGLMIEGWDRYADPLNSVARPGQMGPLWYQAQQLSGMPMAGDIWHTNPPASSHLPCLAVASARLQSAVAQERLLRAMREALMLRGRDISQAQVITAIAEELQQRMRGFDAARLLADMQGEAGRETLREDLRETRYRQIGRFPTLILHGSAPRAVMITGYRPYEALRDAVRSVAPEAPAGSAPVDREAYAGYWSGVLEREWREFDAPLSAPPPPAAPRR